MTPKRSRMMRIVICEVCGELFESNRPQSKYCSAECALIAKKRMEAGRVRTQTPPKCTTDNQNIKEIMRKANEAGLSYGQYVSKIQKTQNRRKKK